jgi:cold-inducible RNA-binding protein
MKILQAALFSLLCTSTAVAFTIAPRHGVVSRSSLVDTRQLQVALSDPNVVANAEDMEDADELAPAATTDETTEMELEPILTTEEVVSAIGSDEPVFSSPPEAEKEEIKLYVGNLPFTATDAQVRQLFENADIPVVAVSLPTNPYRVNEETGLPFSKGFAFVTLDSEELVEKGIKALNEQDFEGRFLRVNKMLPKEELEKTPKRKKFNVGMEGTGGWIMKKGDTCLVSKYIRTFLVGRISFLSLSFSRKQDARSCTSAICHLV